MTLSLFPFTDSSSTEKSTGRGKSPAIWEGVPFAAAKLDPRFGFYKDEDFDGIGVDEDEFTVTALNSGASEGFAKLAQAHGVYSLVATTSADHRGAQVQVPGLGSFDPTNDNIVAVEFVVDLFRCSTFFIGLSGNTTSFFDASSVPPDDVDYIGFYRLNGGATSFVVHNEESTDVDDSAELVSASYWQAEAAGASTPARLGFKFNSSKVFAITVDGVPYKTDALSLGNTACPEAPLTLTLAIARGADVDEADVRLDIDLFQGFCN